MDKNDVFTLWAKYDNDPHWSGNTPRKGIGGTHFFQWMKQNKVDYKSHFEEVWETYVTQYPKWNTEELKLIAGEIHCHYYECGH